MLDDSLCKIASRIKWAEFCTAHLWRCNYLLGHWSLLKKRSRKIIPVKSTWEFPLPFVSLCNHRIAYGTQNTERDFTTRLDLTLVSAQNWHSPLSTCENLKSCCFRALCQKQLCHYKWRFINIHKSMFGLFCI